MLSGKSILLLTALGAIALGLAVWHFAARPDPATELSSSNPDEQRQAIAALGASARTEQGIERIAQAVKSENLSVACGALRALVVSGKPDTPLPPEAVKVAETATQDSRTPVQITSIQVLEATTPPLPEDPTVPQIVLKTFVESKTPAVRAAAANALGKFQYWEAMEPLVNAMEDESADVRSAAGMAVRQILGLDYGFRANAPPSKRQAVVARLRREWRSSKLYHEKYAKRVQQARKAEQ